MTRALKLWLVAAFALLVWVAAAWALSDGLGLPRGYRWELRAGLWILGALTAGVVLWYALHKQAGAAPADEMDAAFAAAHQQLARAAHRATLYRLPVVIVLGPQGSAKTTTVIHSGLDPEVLAGEGASATNTAPAPTRVANIWYATVGADDGSRGVVFVEPGAAIVEDARRWARCIHHLQPARWAAVFGRGAPAPRIALVCVSCEDLIRPGNGDAVLSAARTMRTRLTELAQSLGIALPVYVVFTKADRVSFFDDYTRTLTADEARQPFGATLPSDIGPAGTYADRAAAQLAETFRRLTTSLGAHRLQFLAREGAPERRPGVYEFPREFGKLTPLAAQYLVDLAKPSHLTVSPFLRGFYVTGVQAVVIADESPAARDASVFQPAAAPGPAKPVGATALFDAAGAAPAAAAAAAPVGPGARIPRVGAPAAATSRKVPRWVFLPRLARDVFLADNAALAVTGRSSRVHVARNLLLGGVALAAVLLATAFTVSYVGNRQLEAEVIGSVRAVQSYAPASPTTLPELGALARLDTLRQQLVALSASQRDGAPVELRWGLYTGDQLLSAVRGAYYDAFQRLLLAPTRSSLLGALRAAPDVPHSPTDVNKTYQLLKAYLITTDHPEKSTRAFLSPVLVAQWEAGRPVDTARHQLAARQFDYYSEVLRERNPFPGAADAAVVARARAGLQQGAAAEVFYQYVLAQAAQVSAPVAFNRRYPTAASVVEDAYIVPGEFTRAGWTYVQKAFKNADPFFQGEVWVRGEGAATAPADRAQIIQTLRARYAQEYVAHWREYLRHAFVVPFHSQRDAADKLATLGGGASPLLELFGLAARNTAVDTQAVARSFLPVQLVASATDSLKLITDASQPYMSALLALQSTLGQLVNAQPAAREGAAQNTVQSAASAKTAVLQVAQHFAGGDDGKVGATVQKLMADPIASAEGLLQNLDVGDLNTRGIEFCAQVAPLLEKYPFAPNATVDATPDEVARVFRPGIGALWTFYDRFLQTVVTRQGSQFAPKVGAHVQVSAAFLNFVNRAAAISDVLYKGGAEPEFTFTLAGTRDDSLSRVTIDLDGQTVLVTRELLPTTFRWTAATGHEARLAMSDIPLFGSYQGPWAIFHLFDKAESWTPVGGTAYLVEWAPQAGISVAVRHRKTRQATTVAGGGPPNIEVTVDQNHTPPVLQRGYFSGLNCVNRIVP